MMEFQTQYHTLTNQELAETAVQFAEGQNHMASRELKDGVDYWHYIAIADVLLEAAKRLRNA